MIRQFFLLLPTSRYNRSSKHLVINSSVICCASNPSHCCCTRHICVRCDHSNYNLLSCDALLGNKFVQIQQPSEPNLRRHEVKACTFLRNVGTNFYLTRSSNQGYNTSSTEGQGLKTNQCIHRSSVSVRFCLLCHLYIRQAFSLTLSLLCLQIAVRIITRYSIQPFASIMQNPTTAEQCSYTSRN